MSRLFLTLVLSAIAAIQVVAFSHLDWDDVQGAFFRLADALGVSFSIMIVMLGTTLLGAVAGVVGSFAVLRRRALVGDAVSHAALPGLCIAFMVAGQKDFLGMMLGAAVAGLLGVLIISWLTRNTRTKSDAAIGIVLSVFFGLGISLSRIIQNSPTGQQAGLDGFLFGKTAGMITQDLIVIILVAANLLLLVALLRKEFGLISFDSDFAVSQGWPVGLIDMLLMGAIVVTTIIGLPAVGVVLMAALLILPGVAARFWTDNLFVMLALAAGFGALTGGLGTWISALNADLPAGPTIVLTGAAIFFVSILFAPQRGILARYFERVRFERRVTQQNLLRTMYELIEPQLPARPALTDAQILARRSWSPARLRRLLAVADRDGTTMPLGEQGHTLTEAGLVRAANVVGAFRMWELLLSGHAGAELPREQISRDADDMAAAIPPDVLASLERELRRSGRWPVAAPSPSTCRDRRDRLVLLPLSIHGEGVGG